MGRVTHILTATQKIVCVDDNAVQLRVLVDTINSFDIPHLEVVRFLQPDKAIRYIRSNSDISMIITDYYMPRKSGADMIKELRGSNTGYSIPIIVITASDKEADHETVLKAGALDCIQRPVNADVLYLKIKNHLLTQNTRRTVGKVLQQSTLVERELLAELLMRISNINTSVTEYEACRKTALLAREVMREIGGRGVMIEGITMLLKIMDIGVIGLPNHLQCNEMEITLPTDRLLYEAHVKIGYELLMSLDSEYYRNMAKYILHHHENWDGTGYPHALKESSIPLESRIVRAVKAFAMKEHEGITYYDLSPEAARTEALYFLQENSGTLFDPTVVKIIHNIREREVA